MSWSTSTASPASKATALSDLSDPVLADEVADEQAAQVAAAKAAAALLLGVVGRDSDEVTITLGGHANPGHGPRDGWANETVTVSVSATPPAPAGVAAPVTEDEKTIAEPATSPVADTATPPASAPTS